MIIDNYSILWTIYEDLDKITAQGPYLLRIYKDLNTSVVDDCLIRLSTALEKFKVCPTSGYITFMVWTLT